MAFRNRSRAKNHPRWEDQADDIGRMAGPGIHHITVVHEDHCRILAGSIFCTCDPEVKYGKPDMTDTH